MPGPGGGVEVYCVYRSTGPDNYLLFVQLSPPAKGDNTTSVCSVYQAQVLHHRAYNNGILEANNFTRNGFYIIIQWLTLNHNM